MALRIDDIDGIFSFMILNQLVSYSLVSLIVNSDLLVHQTQTSRM